MTSNTVFAVLAFAIPLSFISAIAPAADAPAPPPPLEAFAELPFMDGPRLSPDGTKVAARISVGGTQRFAIIPLGDVSKAHTITTGDNDLNGWAWVNEDWLVARLGGMSAVQGDKWYLRRAVGIKADATKVVQLGNDAAQNADDILWIAHDGSPHVRIAMQTSIFSDDSGFWPLVRDFDVSTGRSKVVQPSIGNVMNWQVDGTGTVRLGLSYQDGSRAYRVLYRDAAGQSFRTIDKARGSAASLGATPALFLAEPGKAVAWSDDDGFDALYSYDLATLKTGAKLFGAPGNDLDELISDDLGTRLLGVRYTDTRSRTHWFDPAMAKIQSDIDKAVGAREGRIVSWNRDFTVLIVRIGNASNAGQYYVYTVDDGTMRILARVSNSLGSKSYAPVKTIQYKARDGLEISAVLTLPQGKPAKNLPLILMPHGGPAARDDESWDWWAQFLASRGYAVLQPNYRGSTGYGTAFQAKGKGQWGLAMQDDLTDAVRWAATSGLAAPDRVCIVGGSYGGYAALRAAQRDKGVYRCAVSFAGVSDMPAMLRYDGSFLNGGRSKDYLRAQAPDLKGVSPINFAGDVSIPLLLVHGKADTVVPVAQSRDMAQKLKAGNKPVRYVEQPKGDHHFSRQEDRVQFLKELEAFLQANNPA
ncbi:peptidase [Sphingomonas sp. Leaf357]|uniref:alpha/beta hydrolase family protein n=1 Tax=Sphingomonas sp. Leaf357 TaxID=1736350 RepID=UPI0006FF0B1E|nr:S9 family peptidase [Sphingomonas sp. Leaf357]KQS02293.1 peptidase [Sphingomonas sp. Leaf357]